MLRLAARLAGASAREVPGNSRQLSQLSMSAGAGAGAGSMPPLATWQQRAAALAALSISAQGVLAQLGLPTCSLVAPLPLAAACAAAGTPAQAAGASLALFGALRLQRQPSGSSSSSGSLRFAQPNGLQCGELLGGRTGRRYSGGRYWLHQLGLGDTPATLGFVAANALSFGMQCISSTYTNSCARVNFLVASGEWWRLLTAGFVHGNVLHAGVNTLALYNLGQATERLLGSRAYSIVYLGSIIAGNAAGFYLGAPNITSMGSSSGLFGLFASYLTSRVMNRHRYPLLGPDTSSLMITLGINLALLTFLGAHMDTTAHAGGFAGGVVLTLLLGPRYR